MHLKLPTITWEPGTTAVSRTGCRFSSSSPYRLYSHYRPTQKAAWQHSTEEQRREGHSRTKPVGTTAKITPGPVQLAEHGHVQQPSLAFRSTLLYEQPLFPTGCRGNRQISYLTLGDRQADAAQATPPVLKLKFELMAQTHVICSFTRLC